MQPIQHHRSRHHRLYEIIIIATLVVLVTFSLYCLTKSWDLKDSELVVANNFFWSISWPRVAWVAVIGQGRAQHRVIEIYRRNQRGAATEDKIWEAKAAIRVGYWLSRDHPAWQADLSLPKTRRRWFAATWICWNPRLLRDLQAMERISLCPIAYCAGIK